jgi:hypothetical protein
VPVSNAHDLYGLPLERFVSERTALARKLRDEGLRDEAAEVAKLSKPSVAAWAVNQLVRTQGRGVSGLFEAGDALQKAQSELLAGRSDGEALRNATESERAALDALMERARGLLSSQGHELSHATLDRVAETLHAAAVDEEVRAQVKEGSLKKELRHTGLGGPGVSTAPPGTGAREGAARTRGESSKPTPERPRGRRPAEPSADREHARRLEAARKDESDTRRAAQIAEKALEQARERRDRAAAALREADDELATARKRAKEAERAHQRARHELDRIK